MWSEHAEALAALADGQLQQFVQLLIGVVGREAQLVKTNQETRSQLLLMFTMKETGSYSILLSVANHLNSVMCANIFKLHHRLHQAHIQRTWSGWVLVRTITRLPITSLNGGQALIPESRCGKSDS